MPREFIEVRDFDEIREEKDILQPIYDQLFREVSGRPGLLVNVEDFHKTRFNDAAQNMRKAWECVFRYFIRDVCGVTSCKKDAMWRDISCEPVYIGLVYMLTNNIDIFAKEKEIPGAMLGWIHDFGNQASHAETEEEKPLELEDVDSMVFALRKLIRAMILATKTIKEDSGFVDSLIENAKKDKTFILKEVFDSLPEEFELTLKENGETIFLNVKSPRHEKDRKGDWLYTYWWVYLDERPSFSLSNKPSIRRWAKNKSVAKRCRCILMDANGCPIAKNRPLSSAPISPQPKPQPTTQVKPVPKPQPTTQPQTKAIKLSFNAAQGDRLRYLVADKDELFFVNSLEKLDLGGLIRRMLAEDGYSKVVMATNPEEAQSALAVPEKAAVVLPLATLRKGSDLDVEKAGALASALQSGSEDSILLVTCELTDSLFMLSRREPFKALDPDGATLNKDSDRVLVVREQPDADEIGNLLLRKKIIEGKLDWLSYDKLYPAAEYLCSTYQNMSAKDLYTSVLEEPEKVEKMRQKVVKTYDVVPCVNIHTTALTRFGRGVKRWNDPNANNQSR